MNLLRTMNPFRRHPDDEQARRMFETRSHAWREAGLEGEVAVSGRRGRRGALRAQGQIVIFAAMIAAVLVLFSMVISSRG